jgi:uncharacterized iron-regulated membrane protein
MRQALAALHLYLGLFAAVILMIIGATGALLVFENDLDRILRPDLWVVVPEGAPQSPDALVAMVRTAYPDRSFLTLEAGAEPTRPYVMAMEHEFQVFIDPYRGRILGDRDYSKTFWGLMFDLHRTLLAGEEGRRLVGAATVLLLLLILSGLYLWWPRRLTQLASSLTPRWRGSWRNVIFRAHSVLGFYASGALLIVAITGLIWSFSSLQSALFWITGSPMPPWKLSVHSAEAPTEASISLAHAMANAEALLPGASMTEIVLPQRPEDAIKFVKRVPGWLNPNAQSFVSFDQYSGRILQLSRYEDLSVGARLRLLVYPIHVGTILGLPTRILALLVSAFLPVSAFTGFLLWWQRRKLSATRMKVYEENAS